MPSREDTSSRCVSVDNVPKELKEALKQEVARQAGLSEGHILVEEVVGYHTGQSLARFVFLLDHKRNVDRLCEEVKVVTVEKDGKRIDLTFERSTECDIAEEWTKLEAPAESAMGSTPKGPAVPPKAPHRTPRQQPMIASGFYQNVERPSGPPFGPAPGPAPGPMPLDMRQGIPPAYPPQHFNLGSPERGDSGMYPQMPFPHQVQGQPRGQFPQMPYIPGYPLVMGPRGPMQFPVFQMPQMPAEGDKPHGQVDGHYQSNQEFQNMPPAYFDPRILQMFPPVSVAQQLHVHDNQPHSSPPPPYNGSIPAHAGHMDGTAETSKKLAADQEPQMSELKQAIPSPRNKGDHSGISPSKAVGDQEDYMGRLRKKIPTPKKGDHSGISPSKAVGDQEDYMGRLQKKIEKEKDDKKDDIDPTEQELGQQHSADGTITAVDIVLGKLPITMSDHTSQIEVYNPIPQEPAPQCTIEVRGPQEILKSEMLEMYFESERRSSGGEIKEVTREENVTFVTFHSEEVAQRVIQRGHHKINAKMVQVKLHQPRHQESPWQRPYAEEPADDSLWTVKVDSVSQIESMETLLLYFENKRRSGGGEISKFEVDKEEDRAYMTFENEEVARNVVEREHSLSGAKLEVCLHTPVLSKSHIRQDSQQDRAHRLPAEILRMDNKSIELFKKALEDGKERDFNIRLMVVGPFGVGKTTFTKRLFCQDVDISERNSTDGIDIHVGKCSISLKTLDWTVDPADTTDDTNLKRLAKVLGSISNTDTVESLGQTSGYSDSGDAKEKEDIVTNQSDEAQVAEETEMQDQNNSEQALDPDFVDCTLCFNDGDTIDSPTELQNPLMKELKEVVESGDNSEDDECAVVSIWDFGGQFVFYTTHQMFLSHRAIYIIVNDLSQHIGDLVIGDEPYFDCSGTQSLRMEEFIDIWLNSIHGHSKHDIPGEPPVLLVGTHADKLRPEQREDQIEAMFDAIRNRFAGKDASLHFTDKDFGLSNATEDPKFNELRQKIIEVAKQQSHWGELKPAKWIPLERSLEDLRKSGIEIVSRTTMEELNSKLPVPIACEEELDLFLRFQHEVANIMYFSLPELRNKIVLTPQFLVNALKSLITAEMFCKKRPEVLDSWKEFSQKGILKPNLLDAVWKNCENTRFEENRDHILALMEHLNIIARPVSYEENDEAGDCIDTQERDHFLMPCMLKQSPPDCIFQPEESFLSTPCLCLVLENIAFPSAIFNRLLVACMSRWPVARRGKKYLVYCGCGQFDVEVQHRLTLSFSSNVIGLRIVRYCETDRYPSGTVCKDVYNVVKQSLRRIGDGLSLALDYTEFVKCPLEREGSFECLHAVEKMKDCNEFPCHNHDHVEILHSCDLLKYWFDSKEFDQKLDSNNHQQSSYSLPTQVLYRIPTNKQLAKVSKGIGKEYQLLALELGLSQSRIDQIRGSCPLNMRDQIMQLLLEWKYQRGHQATFRELEKAMKSVEIDTAVALQEIDL